MNSVWVVDSVDPLPSEVNLIGIVGGSDNNYWYVWTQERPVGSDITIKRGGASLILGSWVRVTVPRDKLKNDYFLASEKYTVIPGIHETEVVNKTIGLVLQCHISDGTLIQHPFVGPIVNENFEIESEGLYKIRIVRKKPKTTRNEEKSVWFLDGEPRLLQASFTIVPSRVDEPRNIPSRSPSRNPTPLTSELTGIIVAQNTKHLFIWCNERLPGFDVKIRKSENSTSLDLTDYVKFTVSDEQKTIFFPPQMPENGHYPEFELSQYRKVPGQFKTFTTGRNNTTINMTLEVEIQTPTKGDIFHEFVGLILNDKEISFESGRYEVTINRFKNQQFPKSVWCVKERNLISNYNGTAQNLTVHMENLNLAPQSASPIPAQQALLDETRLQKSPVYLEAMILNIVKKEEGREDIHVWIFAKLTQGFLNLHVPAEQIDLEIGSVFGAEFFNSNEKWRAFEVKLDQVHNRYRTRINDEIEILVFGEVPASHPSHECKKSMVKNFGDAIDINHRIPVDFDTLDPFWIKRSKFIDRWEWIVVEVVDTNRNNSNAVMNNGLLPA